MNKGVSAASTADYALHWLENEPQSLLIVDEQLRLLWSNRASMALFDQQQDVVVAGGRLSGSTPNAQDKLAELVQADKAGGMVLIAARDGSGHLLFRSRRLDSASGAPVFGLKVHRASEEPSQNDLRLDVAFGLTPAEHRVLLAMLRGSTADEIARRLDVSIETIRSHIKKIYDKLSVSSREGLFSRLRSFGF